MNTRSQERARKIAELIYEATEVLLFQHPKGLILREISSHIGVPGDAILAAIAEVPERTKAQSIHSDVVDRPTADGRSVSVDVFTTYLAKEPPRRLDVILVDLRKVRGGVRRRWIASVAAAVVGLSSWTISVHLDLRPPQAEERHAVDPKVARMREEAAIAEAGVEARRLRRELVDKDGRVSRLRTLESRCALAWNEGGSCDVAGDILTRKMYDADVATFQSRIADIRVALETIEGR